MIPACCTTRLTFTRLPYPRVDHQLSCGQRSAVTIGPHTYPTLKLQDHEAVAFHARPHRNRLRLHRPRLAQHPTRNRPLRGRPGGVHNPRRQEEDHRQRERTPQLIRDDEGEPSSSSSTARLKHQSLAMTAARAGGADPLRTKGSRTG